MAKLVSVALVACLLVLAACTSQPSAEDTMPRVLDSRTVVLPFATDYYGDATYEPDAVTPSDDAVDAVLEAIDNEPELAWATGHARFLSGRESDDGEIRIFADFSCSSSGLNSSEQALEEMQNLLAVGDGGDCYGWAEFTPTGELMGWGTNGEA